MRMRQKKLIVLGLICLLLASFSTSVYALDADDLTELVGYTIIASSKVVGDFEGADYDKLVELHNGMIFRFKEYKYSYSYRPTVIVFAFPYSESIILYKLIIKDKIYDVDRLR